MYSLAQYYQNQFTIRKL